MPRKINCAHNAAVTLSTVGVTPGSRERLLTAAFIRLTLADVAYFTSTGVAI